MKTHAAMSKVRRDVADNYAMLSDIRRDMLRSQKEVEDRHRLVSDTPTMSVIERADAQCCPGSKVSEPDCQQIQYLIFVSSAIPEPPPRAPRACFGRDELIEKIVGLAENLTPVALLGVGGIGKTSIALTVLHHDCIKQRFGDHRRFIRCDQFPPSCAHLLSRLSKVIGAGVENPDDLASLRPFLCSKEVFIVLDNAESILDPRGPDAKEIYAVVEELGRLENVWLCITSRISTIPSDCETLDIPTLSIEAARDTFYRIYKDGERTDLVDKILGQLDFHPLSITLLATVAHQNKWDVDRLDEGWETQRTEVLQTEHNKSLAAAIELSLASPLFQELGPDARAFLGAVAFFPQGVDENNVDRLFPTIPNGKKVFDKFCMLSLTNRSNGFITMLAPLRDYLSPKDPQSSQLLCATKDHYFAWMSVGIHLNKPDFEETQWIRSEDINVEHLLDVFSTIDPNSDSVWAACANFMRHLFWHKKRLTVLKAKIKGLSDDHHFKPGCFFELSRLFSSVGNNVERQQLLSHALRLERERGNDRRVALILMSLSDSNRVMGFSREAARQAQEALGIYEQFGDTTGQAGCLNSLALSLRDDNQLDAAEEAASRILSLIPETEDSYSICQSHRVLGEMYESKGEIGKAIRHFEMALETASPFNWHNHLFWINYYLGRLSLREGEVDDANARLERAKSHAVNSTYNLGRAMELQTRVWYVQRRLKEARSEVLDAADIFEKLGVVENLERCRMLFQWIEEEMNDPVALYFDGELPETALLPTIINSPWPFGIRKALDGTGSHIYSDISLFSGVSFEGEWFNVASVDLGLMSTSSSQGSAS